MRFKRKDYPYDFDANGDTKTYDIGEALDNRFEIDPYSYSGVIEALEQRVNNQTFLLMALIKILPEKAKIKLMDSLGYELADRSDNNEKR